MNYLDNYNYKIKMSNLVASTMEGSVMGAILNANNPKLYISIFPSLNKKAFFPFKPKYLSKQFFLVLITRRKKSLSSYLSTFPLGNKNSKVL